MLLLRCPVTPGLKQPGPEMGIPLSAPPPGTSRARPEQDLVAIGEKGDEQTDDKIDDVGDTARIAALIKEARELIGSLNTSVRNRFRRDPEILAEWRTASSIHRTGGSGAEEAPVPVSATP